MAGKTVESWRKQGTSSSASSPASSPVSSPVSSYGQAQATADLFADLRKMLNNPKFSDVLFVCQDGVKVHASRMLITARSPVLSSILNLHESNRAKSKDQEISVKSKEQEISLPEVSSATLLSIFEFLYTGTMIEHAPRSSPKAYELIGAARYFQLRAVEELVREFLVDSTADGADDMTKVAVRLTVALEFATVSGAMGAIPISLVRILNSAPLEAPHLRALSEKALRYFLQTTQSAVTDPEMVSFGEYLRFRHIILWCVSQICPDEAGHVVKWCLPNAKSAAQLLRNALKLELSRPLPDESSREAGRLKSLLVRNPDSAALLDSLLTLVDFRRIHAELLVAVVEPLMVVPAPQLIAAFRFQALHKSARPSTTPAYQWEHGSSYGVLRDGLVVRKVNEEIGFARFSLPIGRPYGVYEWEIIVEELCVGFCEIGMHNADGLQDGKPNFTGTTLAQQSTGWALSSHYELGTRISQRGGSQGWVPFSKDFAHKNARVRVHLDMFERSCSFSVDGDEFAVAWMNLPHGVYFPAVSLGMGRTGRVRIELLNGFDML